MVLFGAENFHDLFGGLKPFLGKVRSDPGIFPEQVGQLYGIAQRVDLILAFPEFGFHIGFILLESLAVGRLVESVGIRIGEDAINLFLDQAFQDGSDAGFLPRHPDKGTELAHRIAQPHCRNIPRDYKHRAIRTDFRRSLQRGGHKPLKDLAHLRLIRKMLLDLRNQGIHRLINVLTIRIDISFLKCHILRKEVSFSVFVRRFFSMLAAKRFCPTPAFRTRHRSGFYGILSARWRRHFSLRYAVRLCKNERMHKTATPLQTAAPTTPPPPLTQHKEEPAWFVKFVKT